MKNYGAGMTNEIPEWQRPEWVGRQLRTLGLLDTKDLGRLLCLASDSKSCNLMNMPLMK